MMSVAIAIGATGLAALPAGAAPPVGSGSISGRVVDPGGNPLPDICVVAAGASSTTTDSSGVYSLTGLADGQYAVGFSDCNPSPAYLGQWYLGRTDQASADLVTVVDPADTPLSDVTMATGVSVSGIVTDTGGNPIPNVDVYLNATGPGPGTNAQTASDGSYTAPVLPTGSYTVQFSPTDPLYAGEYWKDQPTWSTADTLVLDTVNGPAQSGIDAQLAAAATIEGTVTDTGGTPLPGICVGTVVPNGSGTWDKLNGTQTLSDGTYSIGGLPAVDVRVRFGDCSGGPYLERWYSGQADFDSSTPIVLASGDVRPGIDAQLGTGTAVSGTVTDGGGNPIPNVNISVDPTGPGSSAFAQTDPAGQYTTDVLQPGSYTVQFHGTPAFAGEYWNDKLSRDDADVLTITGTDGPVLGNIDAVLTTGANVSGRVTDSNGQPIENICVDAAIETSNGIDGVSGASTAADGTYTINGLPPTSVKVVFRDCNTVGPYVQEWWNDAPTPDAASAIALAPGDTRTGIDAQLGPAGAITGRVTDGSGNPLEDICAQASTPTFVGDLATTDSKGHYAIVLAVPGDYVVQFVDCSGSAKFAGEWWDGQVGPDTAQAVHVAPGVVVPGVDAVLDPGAPGSISGKVVNARNTPMTTACVIAYLPYQAVLFAKIQPDGSYTIPNVPSGTYAIAFLGCPVDGEPQPTVPDPDIAGVDYSAFWWDGARLSISDDNDGGPDPIAQGAKLVTVTPGANLVGYNGCFGCTSIIITSITPGPTSLTVAFTMPNLTTTGGAGASSASAASSASGGSVIASVPVTYTVTCSSPSGGVTASASGPGSPITVSGLTSGGSYICRVAAAAGGVIFATSAASDVLAAGTTATGASGSGDPANKSGVTGSLPRTGAASSTTLVRAGFLLLLVGLVLAGSARRRQRPVSGLR